MVIRQAFTLIEVLVVGILILIFFIIAAPFGMEFYREQVLEEQTQAIANNLRVVQSRAMSSKNDSAWGIKFYPEDENRYTLFRGDSYGEREEGSDTDFNFSAGIVVEGISEVVFEKGTGIPSAGYTITVNMITDYGEDIDRTIKINEEGVVETAQ